MAGAVVASAVATGAAFGGILGCQHDALPEVQATERQWQLLASELPAAMLSVSGRSPNDIYAVGADKGHGPLVLHFDGKAWSEIPYRRAGRPVVGAGPTEWARLDGGNQRDRPPVRWPTLRSHADARSGTADRLRSLGDGRR